MNFSQGANFPVLGSYWRIKVDQDLPYTLGKVAINEGLDSDVKNNNAPACTLQYLPAGRSWGRTP